MAKLGIPLLLQEFHVNKLSDYYRLPPGVKSNFISRLYNELNSHAEHAINSIKRAEGVKLHFVVETYNEGMKIANLPSETFLKKVAFFANKTLITFPFHETNKEYQKVTKNGDSLKFTQDKEIIAFGKFTTKRGGYGGVVNELGKNHHLYRSEFDSFLELLCTAKQFIDSDILHIVPAYHPEAKTLTVHTKSRFGLASANFKLDALRKQFTEEGVKTIQSRTAEIPYLYLPYFSNLSSKDVISIREEGYSYYIDFQINLKKMIGEMAESRSEKMILEYMQEIDVGVRKLLKKYEDIQKAINKNNMYALIGFFGVGLTMLLPQPIQLQLTSLLSGMTGLKYLEIRRENDKLKAKFKEDADQLYLMWRIVNPRRNK